MRRPHALAQWLHAISVGSAAAIGVVALRHTVPDVSLRMVLLVAWLVGSSRGVGAFLNGSLNPKRTPQLVQPLTRAQLEMARRQMHHDIHALVDRLALWRAELDFVVDDALRKLNGLDKEDDHAAL